MIIWKGKGIMIFLYFIVTTIVMAILNRLLIETFEMPSASIEALMGTVLIVTGLWTKLTADDYYIDKEGRKKYLGLCCPFWAAQPQTPNEDHGFRKCQWTLRKPWHI